MSGQSDKVASETKALADKLAPWTYVLNTYSAESLIMGFTDLLKERMPPVNAEKKDNQPENKE